MAGGGVRFRGAWLAVVVVACATAPKPPAGRAFVRYPELEAAHVKNAHAFRGQPVCQACHRGESEALLDGPVRTCTRCHQARHTPGHESGTPMDPLRSGGLPLADGRVACHTCHDSHDVKKHRFGLRLPLRQVCLSCHPGH